MAYAGNFYRKPRCLIVDSNHGIIEDLKSLLSSEDLEIISAQTGAQAQELLFLYDFALALIDIKLPDMHGFELAEIMRNKDKLRDIPIIFMAPSRTDDQKVFRGYEAGAVDFLFKPFYPQIVLSKVKIFIDLYNHKKLLEQKLEKIKITENYLEQALKSRDEFLTICSHELKTPLTALKMQIQMYQRKKEKHGHEVAFSEESVRKFLKLSNQSIDKIIGLVNDMLDISRVSSGGLSLNLETFNLSDLANEVTERMMSLLDHHNNPLNTEFDSNIMVQADRYRIEQVLTNLLMNAVKYAPAKPVTLSVKRKNLMAQINVKDEGFGISPHDQVRIFNLFERAGGLNVGGLGLGLHISKEIIKMHNGSISVASQEGLGSTFTVALPLVH